MFQIDNDTSSLNLPAPTAANRPGYFVDGDPAKGLAATILPAEFMNMLMMEFINLVKAAGIAPSKSDYTQLSQAIPVLIAKLATVDWSKVTNIPADLVHLNTTPTLSGIELNSATPFLDFHFNNDAAAYNFRLINSVDGTLSFVNKNGLLLNIGPNIIAAYSAMYLTQGANIFSQAGRSSLGFYNATGGKIDYCFQHDDNAFSINCYPDANPAGFTAINLNRASGQLTLSARPVFNGATPWDSANFNPANKANAATTVAGYGITDAVKVGDFGIGASTAPVVSIDSFGLPGGFYGTDGSASANLQWASVLNLPYQDSHFTAQLAFNQGTTIPHICARNVSSPYVEAATALSLIHI